MHPIWRIYKPDIARDPENPDRFELQGWIAADTLIEPPTFADPDVAAAAPLKTTRRPDIEARFHLATLGFEADCPVDCLRGREMLALNFRTAGQSYEIFVPVRGKTIPLEDLKAAKQRAIMPHLCCPRCGNRRLVRLRQPLTTLMRRLPGDDRRRCDPLGALLLAALRVPPCNAFLNRLRRIYFQRRGAPPPEQDYMVCTRCRFAAETKAHRINFLSNSWRRQFNISATANISSNHYDGTALNLILQHRDGLILDCGAGQREVNYPNVINYEIADYDSTDILGIAERLPFRDAVFDVVFSFAVLEHVQDPVAAAREIVRVLKPGGTLYCQAPFLQPRHGYPHHYFNMTQEGLAQLFSGSLAIKRLEVLNFGQPIFALSWFLNQYLSGLPPDRREAFRKMTVNDLIAPASQYMGEPFVTNLSPEARNILSCCNLLIGHKIE